MFPDLVPAEGPARPPLPARRAATPALFSPSERAERRFLEFFTAHIRNTAAYLAEIPFTENRRCTRIIDANASGSLVEMGCPTNTTAVHLARVIQLCTERSKGEVP